MFRAAVNPYDDIVVKATHEDLLAEDWDANLQICDRVSEEGEQGAKNAVAALTKRLTHRNPNVQLFALELANSLAQNCGRPAHAELSSRAWTGALDRLVSDRTTVAPVKARALKFVKEWTKQFGSDPSLGVMQELYDSLKALKMFDAVDDAPKASVGATDADEERRERLRREEEEELARVLELSKQDKGGRSAGENKVGNGGPSAGPSGASRSNAVAYPDPKPSTTSAPQPFIARDPTPPPVAPSKATAARVRAIYPFDSRERGELSFEKGDIIKVIDRMYDEWYTGAVGGRIGIFPVSYVEPLPDPTPAELAKEAQEEARVFAAQGLIVNLQRMLDRLDPSRGDRIEDNPEIEELYRRVVEVQPEIVGLMKKYSDQKAELEHIHLGFVKAQRQYTKMTQPPPAQPGYPMGYAGHPQGYAPRPGQDHRASSYSSIVPGAGPHPQAQLYPGGSPAGVGYVSPQPQPDQQAAIAAAWAQYHQQQQQQQQLGVPSVPNGGASPSAMNASPSAAAAAPVQSPEEAAKIAAAWQAYYAAQAQYAQQMAANGWSQQQIQEAQAQAAGQSGQQMHAHEPAPSHQPSGDVYAGGPARGADNASIRSVSGPSATQSHGEDNVATQYGHQSRASLSMPQPQVYGHPATPSQTDLNNAPPPPAKDDPFFSAAPVQGSHMTASPQPMPMPQGVSHASAPPQTENPWAHNVQHGRASGSYGDAGYATRAANTSGQQGMPTSNSQQFPRIEGGQAGQSQTGLETAVADMAFR